MLAVPSRAWSGFKQSLAEHWEAVQHAHPRDQTADYDGLVAQRLVGGDPEKSGDLA